MAQTREGFAQYSAAPVLEILSADFFNTIHPLRTFDGAADTKFSALPAKRSAVPAARKAGCRVACRIWPSA